MRRVLSGEFRLSGPLFAGLSAATDCLFLLFLISVTVVVFCYPARAFDLNFRAIARVDAQVGIDGPTRAFLGRLPGTVRTEISVRQSLDTLDIHAAKYLAQVDAIISNQINDLACKSTAATEMMATAITGKIFKSKNTHVADLLADFQETRESFSSSDPPATYRVRYADLHARSVVTYCQVALSGPAKEEVSRIQDSIRPVWSAWARLDGVCEGAEDCFPKLKEMTEVAVNTSEPWDKQQVSAQERLNAISDVPRRSWWRAYNSTPYEGEFVKMFAIQDELRVTKELREASARQDVQEATEAIDRAQAAWDRVGKLLKLPRWDKNAITQNLEKVSSERELVVARLRNAVETMPAIDKTSNDLLVRYNKLCESAEVLRSFPLAPAIRAK